MAPLALDHVPGNAPLNFSEQSLPTFEDVCLLDQPTFEDVCLLDQPTFEDVCLLDQPTFEDVCLLDQPTLCFIPSKSWPAFAQALSSALRSVMALRTQRGLAQAIHAPEVCPLRHKGRHDKPLPVDTICNM